MITAIGFAVVAALLVWVGKTIFLASKNETLEETPKARRVNGGTITLRKVEDDHLCDPPDRLSPDSIYIHNYKRDTMWVPGDSWICDCGYAWVVDLNFPGSTTKVWRRDLKGDIG